jgi:hypothetical protein
MLTVDIEDVTVSYPSMFELLQDLGDMGEGNAIIGRYVVSYIIEHIVIDDYRTADRSCIEIH